MRILFLILFMNLGIYSQSFDWELSNRLPFQIPNLYLYGDLSYGLNYLNGEVVVDTEQNNFIRFEDANGNNFRLSVGVEYWYLDNLTFNVGVGFSKMSDKFSQTENLPIFNGEMLILENNYNSNYNNLSISLGSKYRLYDKLNIGGMLIGNMAISANHNFEVEVLAPQWYLFRNGTKNSELFNNKSNEIRGSLHLAVELSYDIQLSYPIYISPYFQASRNIVSQYRNSEISFYMLNFGLRFNYGI